MAEPPNRDPRLLEALEACRPGSDDLEDPAMALLAEQLAADPELAELAERLTRVDASVAEAFGDVPLPDGLAERITARLAAAGNGLKPPARGPKAQQTGVEAPSAEAAKRPTRLWPRWVLAGTVAAAVAATVIAAVVVPLRPPQDLDQQAVLDGAREFFMVDRDAEAQPVAEVEPPDAYPTDPDFDVRRFPRIRWRSIRGFLGRQGVAYDLGAPRTPRATLYVVRCTVPGLPSAAPPQPSSTTRGVAIGAWQRDNLLYVLVVEGEPGIYQRLLPAATWT
jgi:negative regulator of sigma E activity